MYTFKEFDMKLLRILLIFMTVGIIALSINAINIQGPNLLKHAVWTGWQGQFNFDFICYLVISALWVLWRHHFSFKGVVFSLLSFVGGILFFAPYLIVISLIAKGSIIEVIIGKDRLIKLSK